MVCGLKRVSMYVRGVLQQFLRAPLMVLPMQVTPGGSASAPFKPLGLVNHSATPGAAASAPFTAPTPTTGGGEQASATGSLTTST